MAPCQAQMIFFENPSRTVTWELLRYAAAEDPAIECFDDAERDDVKGFGFEKCDFDGRSPAFRVEADELATIRTRLPCKSPMSNAVSHLTKEVMIESVARL